MVPLLITPLDRCPRASGWLLAIPAKGSRHILLGPTADTVR